MSDAESVALESRLKAIIDTVVDGIITIDSSGIVRSFNPAAERIFGYAAQEIIGKNVSLLMPEPHRSGHDEYVARYLRTGERRIIGIGREVEGVRKDGSRVPIELAVSEMRISGERWFTGVTRDICDRKRAEEALRQSEENLAVTLYSIGEGILATDADGRITRLNRAAERLTGWTEQEAKGRQVVEVFRIIDAKTRAPARLPTLDVLQLGTIHGLTNDTVLVARDGTERPIADSCAPIRAGDGRVVGSVLVFRDVAQEYAAQVALREREAELGSFKHTLDQILDCVFICRADDLRFLYVNKGGQQQVGYSEAELRQMTPLDIKPEFTLRTYQQLLQPLRDGTEDAVRFQTLHRHKDGHGVPVEVAVQLVQHEERDACFVAIVRDITERQRAEEQVRALNENLERTVAERTSALRATEQRFHNLFESAPDALVGTNARGIITLVNQQAERLFGWIGTELLGQPVEILLPQEHRKGHPELRERYLQDAVPRPMGAGMPNLRAVRKDGTEFPAEISLSPIDTEEGRRVVAAVRDMTERRRIEESLRESEERYRQLVESASEVFYKVITPGDPLRGDVEFVSQSVERVTGHAPQDFVRNPDLWARSIHPDDFPAVAESTGTCLTTGESAIRSYRIQDRTGTYHWMEDRITPLMDPEGRVRGYQGVARDVTERKQLEVQLLQSQKLETVGQLAGGIAHDFNNLLTVILGTIDLNQANLKEDDALYADLQDMRQAGERAAVLTRQLLAFSRKQILQPEVLNLNTVVERALGMARRLIGEHINVVFKPAHDLGSVKVDLGQIEQVLMNLVVNARDAMPTGGTLTIETQNVVLDEDHAATHRSVQPGPHVMLAVSDTGVGMDEATRLQIFEPFFTTKGHGKGTGLGLSTAYGIVKQSRGSIWAYSELGRGSTFKVYLPHVAEKVLPGEPVQAVTITSGSETILVVEDEPVLRQLAKRLLESAGYEVLVAVNGEDALAVLARYKGPVHLLLTDVIMPGMSGRDLAEQVLVGHPEIKVLYTSGYTDEAIVHHGVLNEGTHLLNKPYTVADLASKVRHVLDS